MPSLQVYDKCKKATPLPQSASVGMLSRWKMALSPLSKQQSKYPQPHDAAVNDHTPQVHKVDDHTALSAHVSQCRARGAVTTINVTLPSWVHAYSPIDFSLLSSVSALH